MPEYQHKNTLRRAIIDHIASEIKENASNEDLVENLEIVKQCLENSFSKFALPASAPELLKTFTAGLNPPQVARSSEDISAAERETAEQLKNQGNACMKEENYKDAVNCYSEALKIDPNNPVFLCNRAAAYSKMNKFIDSIVDCNMALKIDPNYSKAYGRMGLAYSSLGDTPRSIECYKKSLELDPNNESAKQNLQYAESRQANNRATNPTVNNLAEGLPAGLNIGEMQRIAGQMMSDPNMSNIFSNLLSNFMSQNISGEEQQSGNNNTANPPTNNSASNLNDLISNIANAAQAGTNAEGGNNPAAPNLANIFNDPAFRRSQETLMSNPDLMNSLLQNLTNPRRNDSSNTDNIE